MFILAGCRREEKDRALVNEWLTHNCSVSGHSDLVRQVAARGAAIEPLFLEAFRKGPPQARQNSVIASVERDWSQIQVQLAEPEIYGLSPEEITEMKSVSLANEKRQALDRSHFNYRSAAIEALGITKGAAGREELLRISRDNSSRFRSIALLALARARK